MGVWTPGPGATAGVDTFTGDGTNETADGLGGNDTLNGNGGDDTLRGNTGVDTVSGGENNDTLVIIDGDEEVGEIYNGGNGTDTLRTSGNISVTNDVYTFTSIEALTFFDTGNVTNIIYLLDTHFAPGGLSLNLAITTYANLFSDAVNITMSTADADFDASGFVVNNFGDGIDHINFFGNNGSNTIVGTSVTDWLRGGTGADQLFGGAGNDDIRGESVFAGDGAVDTLTGGTGNDFYSILEAIDIIVELPGEGDSDGVYTAIAYTLPDNVENMLMETTAVFGTGNASGNTISGSTIGDTIDGAGGNDFLFGNDAADTLIGGAGNDLLNGGSGVDDMAGGADNDTYVVDDASDIVTEGLNAGTDTIQTNLNVAGLTANVENLTLTGSTAVTANGNFLNNIIYGNDQNNSINGLGGADEMNGGLGNDTYYVDNAGDLVFEFAGEGTDTIRSAVGVAALAFGVENLILLGAAATGNGNELNNSITGNASNNSINGGTGADTMSGGTGNDTYFVDNAGDVVIEASGEGTDIVFSTTDIAALGANVENLTISASALLATGNGLNNTINGNAQNNTLNGGGGEDTLAGGLGNDLYVVNSAGDTVTEGVGAGTDSILSFLNVAALGANIENVTLAGTATTAVGNTLNNVLTGNALNNTLTGGDGNDQLNGGVGADTMIGGLGDDAYLVENAGDVVSEAPGEGTDIVYAYISIAGLASGVDRLTIVGAGNLDGTGNGLDNRLNGNEQNNALTGLAGADVIQGLGGTDVLTGGAGLDTLTGGGGDDTFVYQALSDSGTTGATRDVINDFTFGNDVIDLSAIDANAGVGGDQAFSFIGTAAFSGAGQLRYDQIDNPTGTDFTIISMDVNGDGIADSQITLVGLVTLVNTDFGL